MYEIETDDFYKDISPMLEISLILVTIQKITHRELKLGLIRKLLECLRMKLVD